MRLERLDKLAQSIERKRAASQPMIPEAPETGATAFRRPMDGDAPGDAPIDADARGSTDPYFQRRERLKEDVENANRLAETLPKRGLLFELDYSSDEWVVIVMDPETKEVLRRMPPAEFLTFMTRVREVVGLFFDRIA